MGRLEKFTIAPDSPAAEAIKTIKEILTTEPVVLAHPDFEKQFTIETDGSVEGLGAVLTQEGKVIEYASRRLTKAESNYTTRELECLALLFGVRKFHRPIFGTVRGSRGGRANEEETEDRKGK